jgi:hypothetical protein
MAPQVPDDTSHQWRADRSARFWKKASELYSQACTAQSPEAKAVYMEVAMAWAALAHEVERPVGSMQHDDARHHPHTPRH